MENGSPETCVPCVRERAEQEAARVKAEAEREVAETERRAAEARLEAEDAEWRRRRDEAVPLHPEIDDLLTPTEREERADEIRRLRWKYEQEHPRPCMPRTRFVP
jgi:hypothetical protein